MLLLTLGYTLCVILGIYLVITILITLFSWFLEVSMDSFGKGKKFVNCLAIALAWPWIIFQPDDI